MSSRGVRSLRHLSKAKVSECVADVPRNPEDVSLCSRFFFSTFVMRRRVSLLPSAAVLSLCLGKQDQGERKDGFRLPMGIALTRPVVRKMSLISLPKRMSISWSERSAYFSSAPASTESSDPASLAKRTADKVAMNFRVRLLQRTRMEPDAQW